MGAGHESARRTSRSIKNWRAESGSSECARGVRKLSYGNREIGAVVARCWLDGPLRISAAEQTQFLSRLTNGELPVGAKAADAVKGSDKRNPEELRFGSRGICPAHLDELRHKPLDRELLDRFASSVGNAGLICDMGIGPGHVGRYLRERGLQLCGIDLAPEMIEHARELNPGIDFRQGDMFQLDRSNECFAGVTAFYAIVNIPADELVRA